MAGSVEHFVVAWNLLERWSKRDNPEDIHIQDRQRFMLGNLCPDSVMSRPDYKRPMKMHTHFRDGIADADFAFPRNQEKFHQRICMFVDQFCQEETPDLDLYLGYVTHILTDEVFMLTVRPEFMEKIEDALGLTQYDIETFTHFSYDVNQIDRRLAREAAGMRQVKEWLSQVPDIEIPGLVSAQEIQDSARWVLDFFFDEEKPVETPKYYTYERAAAFIRDTTQIVAARMEKYLYMR